MTWLLGSLRLGVQGADIERLLNQCAARGVGLWDVRRLDADRVELSVTLEGYFALRGMSRRAMCRIRVIKKRGAPFKAGRLEKRLGLMLGLALCIAAAWYLSGFVWTIGIEGCQTLSQRELLHMLEQAGLRTGSPRRQLDPLAVRNEVMLMTDRLSYFVVNLRGTHAQVTVRERTESPPRVPQELPCDVVSDKTGVIVALRVREGVAQVKVGQTLVAGDVIARGDMMSTQGQAWQVHASAEADVRVWHNRRCRLPDSAQAASTTGRVAVRRALILGNRRINLYFIETEPFACYDKRVEKNALSLGADFRFPIVLVTETYTETHLAEAAIDRVRAAQLLEGRMRQALAAERPDAKVQSVRFDLAAVGGAFEGRLLAECIETAGVEREIAR